VLNLVLEKHITKSIFFNSKQVTFKYLFSQLFCQR